MLDTRSGLERATPRASTPRALATASASGIHDASASGVEGLRLRLLLLHVQKKPLRPLLLLLLLHVQKKPLRPLLLLLLHVQKNPLWPLLLHVQKKPLLTLPPKIGSPKTWLIMGMRRRTKSSMAT